MIGPIDETAEALRFFSRLPVPVRPGAPAFSGPAFSLALRRAPFAGAVLGLLSGLVLFVGATAGAPAQVAAWLAVGLGTFVTGAMHEDGIADVADGFGGGYTRERRLEIMRDSRIGSFGAAALIPPARSDGLGRAAALSRAQGRDVLLATLVFAATPLLAGFSLVACALALLCAGLAVRALNAWAQDMIGGQTGDVAGAAQQLAEIAVLAVFAGALA